MEKDLDKQIKYRPLACPKCYSTRFVEERREYTGWWYVCQERLCGHAWRYRSNC